MMDIFDDLNLVLSTHPKFTILSRFEKTPEPKDLLN